MQPLLTLQKKAIRLITFSSFTEHSRPLFEDLKIMKLSDIITLQLAVFIYKLHYQLLPSVFDTFFNPIHTVDITGLVNSLLIAILIAALPILSFILRSVA